MSSLKDLIIEEAKRLGPHDRRGVFEAVARSVSNVNYNYVCNVIRLNFGGVLGPPKIGRPKRSGVVETSIELDDPLREKLDDLVARGGRGKSHQSVIHTLIREA